MPTTAHSPKERRDADRPRSLAGLDLCYCNASRARALTPVPHFYFDAVLNGKVAPDPEGVELGNRDTARQEAVRAAAEMAKDSHLDGNARDIIVRVREGREPVATVRLSILIEDA
jgi:hypothetical protein